MLDKENFQQSVKNNRKLFKRQVESLNTSFYDKRSRNLDETVDDARHAFSYYNHPNNFPLLNEKVSMVVYRYNNVKIS
jgi:hypothetical protein